MYNVATTEMNNALDSKYTVADILSSMASGEPLLTPNYSGAPTLTSGVTTPLTSVPLLTPTTLATLEQTFTELQSAVSTTTPGAQPLPVMTLSSASAPLSYTRTATTESGFMPPVINMVKQEYNDCGSYDESDDEWLPPQKRARVTTDDPTTSAGIPHNVIKTVGSVDPAPGPRRHTGPRRTRKDDYCSPEEAEKKRMRRERNKLAAAKCRQRRVDLTNTLLAQTEVLEEDQSELENDIQNLLQQKEQLEFLLQAHKPVCNAKNKGLLTSISIAKTVKSAPVMPAVSSVASSTTAGASNPPRTTAAQQLSGAPSTTRPNTLPIPARTHVSRSPVTEATGVSITTPSSGVVFNFGLESMMDGHTGLTPLTGGPSSCASQVQRNSSDSASSSNDALSSPTTLISL